MRYEQAEETFEVIDRDGRVIGRVTVAGDDPDTRLEDALALAAARFPECVGILEPFGRPGEGE